MNFLLRLIRHIVYHPIQFFLGYFIVFTLTYGVATWLWRDYSYVVGDVPNTTFLLVLGIISGLLQLLGYILYIRDENIEPNPVTWFMFAYGTGILMILEWDAEATLPELILPTVCGVLAIYVSFRCWKKSRRINPKRWWPEDWWPEDKWEQWSFISDIIITIAYISAWVLAGMAFLSPEYREYAVLAFLFLSNLSTFPAFYPLLHETYLHPHKEHWLPWAVWALAYAILAIVTYITHDSFWHPLMFYPVSNALLHGLVSVIVIARKK